jgi:tellurite resistance protein TehA-like permease
MATGIVSIGLSVDDHESLSRVLLVLAALVWCVVVAAVILGDGLEHAHSPAALTWVAGTGVLGERLSLLGWNDEAAALLVLAVLLWAALVPAVLAHWRTPTVGTSFLLTVATESLAVLSSRLGLVDGLGWLAFAGLALCGLGLLFYATVLARFDVRELLRGCGDHWIAGGALAIAALACARSAQAAGVFRSLHGAAGDLDAAALGVWAAAAAWLPVLVVCEAARRRTAFDERRWSTVFPLGMYAACSFATARVAGIGGLADFGRVWIWVAFAAWLLVAYGLFRQVVVSGSKKS